MYLTVDESVSLAESLRAIDSVSHTTAIVFPSSLAFTLVRNVLRGGAIALGAQNCSWAPRGAYTGAISAELWADAGASYVLVGHSERRHIFGEGDTAVHKKFSAALDAGLVPILCIGETQEEKENSKREYRLKKQLLTALSDVDLSGKKFMVAYEPVWAIGTGDNATARDVEKATKIIYEQVSSLYGAAAADGVRILYGGSVNDENADIYLGLPRVNGLLPGSASLQPHAFAKIVDLAHNKHKGNS
jgi:triosephosphate isomerase